MRPIFFALTAVLACSALAAAPEPAHEHEHAQSAGPVAVDLGTTHFPTSGAPLAQSVLS